MASCGLARGALYARLPQESLGGNPQVGYTGDPPGRIPWIVLGGTGRILAGSVEYPRWGACACVCVCVCVCVCKGGVRSQEYPGRHPSGRRPNEHNYFVKNSGNLPGDLGGNLGYLAFF